MKLPELVEGASGALRWFSMQAMALNFAILTTWAALPNDLKASISPKWVMLVAAIVTACGIVGRLIKQTPPPTKE